MSGTPAVGTHGQYSLTFIAGNGVGSNAVSTVVLTVVSQTPPAITSVNQTTFAAGLPAGNCTTIPYNCFLVTTTGYPAPKLTVSAGFLPSGSFIDNGNGTATISFAPTRQVPDYRITITATGAGGAAFAATQAFTLHVLNLPTAPTFSSADQVAFTSGIPNSFTVAAGPFVSNIRITAGGLPAGITFTDNRNGTATLSGIPNPSPAGATFGITFTAGNPYAVSGTYSTTQNFTLSLLP